MESDLAKLKWAFKQVLKLTRLNAPPALKAQCLVRLIIPRIVKMCNMIPEYAAELGYKLAEYMAENIGCCLICKKADATCGDLCVKCNVGYNQMMADMNLLDEIEDPFD